MDKSETDYFQIFYRTTRLERVSDERKINDVYGPTPDIAETSPHGHPDLRRGFPNPSHAGEARWNPNCLSMRLDCERVRAWRAGKLLWVKGVATVGVKGVTTLLQHQHPNRAGECLNSGLRGCYNVSTVVCEGVTTRCCNTVSTLKRKPWLHRFEHLE